ncbi:hypothetical protein LXL04_036231 [Taraxacum kok-saghyz]
MFDEYQRRMSDETYTIFFDDDCGIDGEEDDVASEMGVYTFVCKSSGGNWTAKQLKGDLEGSADSTYALQRSLVQAALSCDSSGGVQSSFSYVLPDSAVFQVIVGGSVGGASFGGGAAAAAAPSGGGAAAAEAPAAEEKKEEKEESDDDMGDSDQMWTSSERFYPNVNKFGTFLPKCGQDGSGYSKPLPLLFLVVDGNIAGDAPPPLILRLFLSLRLREFEREIGGGSRAFLFSWASRLNHPKTLSPARARDPGDVPNHYRKKKR